MYDSFDIIPLRPHHGLCLHFFRGLGYSEKFVEKMLWLKRELKRNPIIELVSGTDVVCDACPNSLGEVCVREKQFSRYDRTLLLSDIPSDGKKNNLERI